MALTLHPLTVQDQLGLSNENDGKYFFGSVNLDTSYPTGGYSLESGISDIFGMTQFQTFLVSPAPAAAAPASLASCIYAEIVFTNSLPSNLKLRTTINGTEVPNATNLSGITLQMAVFGY